MGTIIQGAKAESKKAKGKIMALLIADPLNIAQITCSSLEAAEPEACSAATAKSSPKIPAVF